MTTAVKRYSQCDQALHNDKGAAIVRDDRICDTIAVAEHNETVRPE